VYTLGVAVWRAAYEFLTDLSRACPPTGCQLLLYYSLFQSAIGRHRDNYTSQQMVAVINGERRISQLLEGSHHGGDANSQVTGSNVLIWTEGPADMQFCLSFPPRDDLGANRDEYVIHPTFCVALGAGTLLIFSPVDDLFFCHEAFFLRDGVGGYRLAFVFRWLSQERNFYCCTNTMKLSAELEQKEAELKRKRAAKSKRQWWK